MRRILFVFLDGVGLGPASANNPLSTHSLPAFEQLAGHQPWTADLSPVETTHRVVRPLDATLGVEGLPQSGTGQATLFTGVNCAARVGRHFGPFPHSATHDLLDRESIFHQVNALSLPASSPSAFANAYPPRFFDHVEQSGRWTVTTRCCRNAGVEVRGLEDVQNERALTAELTGMAWRDKLDLDVNEITEQTAGTILADTQRSHAFTLFEYFLTDKAGHGRLDDPPKQILHSLDRFFGAILKALDPDRETLLVTSDHGNIEDLGRTTHTRNPVPLIVHGWAAPYFTGAADLTAVTPAIVTALQAEQPSSENSNVPQ